MFVLWAAQRKGKKWRLTSKVITPQQTRM
jgi:hypothetical protein